MKWKEGLQGATFGIMEGLVMVMGILFGLGFSGVEKSAIVLLILLTAFADGVANTSAFYVSEETETFHSRKEILKSAFFTFIGTTIAFSIPIIPIILLPLFEAIIAGTVVASIMLIFLGYFVGKVANRNWKKLSIKYLVVGLIAAAVTYVAGQAIGLLL